MSWPPGHWWSTPLVGPVDGTSTDPAPAGWKVPRTPDGQPDLQGVWGNNSVTPMTRPTQWKDKTVLTDAEVEELKQLSAQFVDQGGDAIFGNFVQMMLNAKDKGAFDAGLVRPDHRQLQPVLDGRSRMGQPHLAHHRSA